MRQSSSLMPRLFTARVYFINHRRWAELLQKPNIYTQTQPSPLGSLVSQRFWSHKVRIICLSAWIPEGHGSLEFFDTQCKAFFFRQTNRLSHCPSPLCQLPSSVWGLTLGLPPVSPETLHWFLFHRARSLSVGPKQTAADRRWIRKNQMRRRFGADGQRGGWVKGSCLIIQGSSLIMSESRVRHIFLIWNQLKKYIYIYIFFAILIYGGRPNNRLAWVKSRLKAEDLAYPKIFEKEVTLIFRNTKSVRPPTEPSHIQIYLARSGSDSQCLPSEQPKCYETEHHKTFSNRWKTKRKWFNSSSRSFGDKTIPELISITPYLIFMLTKQ